MDPSLSNECSPPLDARPGCNRQESSDARKRLLKVCILIVIFVAILCMVIFLPVKSALLDASEWIQSIGVLGYIVFVLAFTILIVFGLPSTSLEVMSGFLFGFWWSTVVTTIGKNTGCAMAFLIGRSLGRDTVGRYLKKKFPTFDVISHAFDHQGNGLLCLIQLAYIPISLKNYGLSMLDVRFANFICTALLCGFPYTLFWSYLGSTTQNILELLNGEGEVSSKQLVIAGVGIVSGAVAMVILARYTKKAMAKIREEDLELAREQEASQIHEMHSAPAILIGASTPQILPQPQGTEPLGDTGTG
mmetsp:Transcript_62645/g.136033  ORF Transcript_62645/g.136033 Transcript_62645/m.136033 type:complete len:304 (-) Transcript_62645:305-1216(-)